MTREELLNKPYLNRKDIESLFDVPRQVAERIYNQADMIDDQMKFRAYPNKVRMQTVLNVQELDYELLKAQIKNADSLPNRSAQD